MLTLFHHPFSPASRFVRLVLTEYGAKPELVIERPWERRREFLLLNPAGSVPVLQENDGPPVCGVFAIMEYLDETRGYAVGNRRLMPDHPDARAETRRLVDWAVNKLDQEVVGPFVRERVYKQEMPTSSGGGAPDSTALRAARANIRHHMRYFGYLAASRNWIAGSRLGFADFAVAAELSCADYLGEVPWEDEQNVKTWYSRIKSRPSFRPLLGERVRGIPPAATYEDLDF